MCQAFSKKGTLFKGGGHYSRGAIIQGNMLNHGIIQNQHVVLQPS